MNHKPTIHSHTKKHSISILLQSMNSARFWEIFGDGADVWKIAKFRYGCWFSSLFFHHRELESCGDEEWCSGIVKYSRCSCYATMAHYRVHVEDSRAVAIYTIRAGRYYPYKVSFCQRWIGRWSWNTPRCTYARELISSAQTVPRLQDDDSISATLKIFQISPASILNDHDSWVKSSLEQSQQPTPSKS